MCFGTNQPMVRLTAALKADAAGDLLFPPAPAPALAPAPAPETGAASGVVNVRASVRDFSLHSLRFPDTDEDLLLASVFGMSPLSPAVSPAGADPVSDPVSDHVSHNNNNDDDDDAVEVQPEPELGTAAAWDLAPEPVCWAGDAMNEAEEDKEEALPAPPATLASPATSATRGGGRTAPDSAPPTKAAARTLSTTQDRLERNRTAAAQSRLRKKMRTAALEADARQLEARQADLRGGIARLALENAVLRTELAGLRAVLAQSAAHFGSHITSVAAAATGTL